MVGAVISAIVVVAVAASLLYPLFRPPLEPVGEPPGPAARLAALEDRRAAIYGAIRDLGQDFRTDKLTEDDYRRESETLKSQAVAVLAEIDALRGQVPRADGPVEERIAAIRARLTSPAAPPAASEDAGTFCTSCGRKAEADDRFCAGCGAELRGKP